MRDRKWSRAVAPCVIAFGLYVLARMAVAQAVPWHRAFDDFFYLPETLRWLEAGRLGSDGVFLRVPLWNLLLGLCLALFGSGGGLLALQGMVVFGAIACQVVWARRVAPDSRLALWLPMLIFLASPQVLLYSRQAVNELFIGLITLCLILVGERRGAQAAPALGALVALAAMAKLSAGLIGVVAIVYVVRDPGPRLRDLARLAGGFAAIALPLVAFTLAQRGGWILDNTSAYNLSGISLGRWRALGDPGTRQSEAMAMWWSHLSADPLAYAEAFVRRAAAWVLRPSSADFAFFYKDYPMILLKAADSVVLLTLTMLAAFGTRQRDIFLWWLSVGWVLACTFPLTTPGSPKVLLVFPAMLLATRGVARLQVAWTARVKEGLPAGQDAA